MVAQHHSAPDGSEGAVEGVIKIPNHKFQMLNKFQISKLKTTLTLLVVASFIFIYIPVQASAKQILAQSGVTYLGYYDVPNELGGGSGIIWGQGFTHRYVNGQLRFLTFTFMGNDVDASHQFKLVEFALPSSFGSAITSITNSWVDINNGAANYQGKHVGIWWDEPKQRLWTTSAIDYPGDSDVTTKAIYTRTLNSDGTVSNLKGAIGLLGINSRRIYGGAQAVPTWFQQQYGVGPYMVGWGGYASRAAAGGLISLGPTAYIIPDPSSFANNTDIPAGQFKTLMDYSSGMTTQDWYAQGAPTTFDRGVRNSDVINYFDGGDTRQNPSTPPTGPPQAGAQWLSPAPDGLGRWIWGDSNYNTGMWIETANKLGFMTVPSLGCGMAYYGGSTLHTERRCFEFQVFDPANFGEAIQGNRQPWNVKPSSRWVITLPGMGVGTSGNGPSNNVAGATYDPTAQRVYVYGFYAYGTYPNNFGNRIYVYQVNDQTPPPDTTPPAPPTGLKVR